jgi:FG-GAP-like repeat/Secretion system C-terminal sorting domain/IPT/TIG domain
MKSLYRKYYFAVFLAFFSQAALSRPEISGTSGPAGTELAETSSTLVINSFTPISGGTGTIVTIKGSSFSQAIGVYFGGVSAASFTIINDTTITAVVGAGGTGDVSVYNSYGPVSLGTFTFLEAGPPIIRYFEEIGIPNTYVTIVGNNFYGATAVSFGGTPALSFSVSNDTAILAILGYGSAGSVTVTTNNGTASLPGFYYNGAYITSFTPDSANAGMTVTIKGQNFIPDSGVSFGGIPAASYTVVSDSVITAVVSSAGASGAVTAYTVHGTATLGGFVFTSLSPLIKSFTPTSGTNGTVISIYGRYFTGASAVSFGTTPATGYTVISDTLINATVGFGSSGFVKVTTPQGADSLSGFMINTPIVTSFAPDSGITGATIIVHGKYFTGATAVSFGDSAAASFTVLSDTLLEAVVGNGHSGYVSVVSPEGSDSLARFVFMATRITGFYPTIAAPGETITITGEYFTGANSVSFGGIAASSFVVVSDSIITATVGSSGATGNILVSSPHGTGAAGGFTFNNFTPIISSISPDSGVSGSRVTIYGANFNPVPSLNVVYFGAVQASVLTSTSTEIVVNVLPGATYQPITVTTGGYTAYAVQEFDQTFPNGGTIDSTSFGPKKDITVGSYPRAAAVVDLDGDNRPDIIVPDFQSNSFSVLRNTASADTISFAPSVTIPGQYDFVSVAVGDLDGDGKPDIVFADQNVNNISIFKNNSFPGTISLAPKMDIVNGTQPYGSLLYDLKIADVDGDGKPDIIVIDANILVYLNTSSAAGISFAPASVYPITFQFAPYQVALNDLDGDGKPDFAVVNSTADSVMIIQNNSTPGRVSFGALTSLPTGSNPQTVAIADLDRDGLQDLIVGNASSNTVSVFLNKSRPGLLSFAPGKDFATGLGPSSISVGDIDGDGKPDLAIANRNANTFSILKNISVKGVAGFAPKVDFNAEDEPDGATIADLDGDGRPDIVVSEGGGGAGASISLFKNQIFDSLHTVINSFSPDSGTTGTTITIKGAHFSGTSTVSFGGTSASSFIVVSDTIITAVVSTGASGNVSVSAEGGGASLSGFTFIAVKPIPVITSFSPDSAGTGDTVMIYGNHLTGADSVSFGGIPAASFVIISDSVIAAVTGVGTSGDILVTSSGGQGRISGFVFISPSSSAAFHLIQFAGEVVGNLIELTWQTLNDGDISSFTLQKSTDSLSFVTIGTVNAIQLTGIIITNDYNDSLPQDTVNYYRLGITDNVGNTRYSFVLAVHLPISPQSIRIFPNPAQDLVTVQHPSTNANATIELLDMSGRISKIVQIASGVTQTQIHLTGIMTGVYKLVWSDGKNSFSRSILIR